MTATTIAELPQTAHIYVRADGRGDYATIQEAVLSVPENNQIPTVIHLAPGVYHEEVVISGARPLVTIVGEDPLTTEISYGRYAGMMWENGDPTTTFRTATLAVYANHFCMENVGIRNSYDGSQSGGRQALALYASGEHHIYRNCRFYGGQDTLYSRDGFHYFERCYIDGDVDFIFGGARAVFYQCEIYCKNPNPEDREKKGYIAAPSTPAAQRFGLVFMECNITGNMADGMMFLGRPWHPASDPYYVGMCVFMRCELGSLIAEAGWKQMGGFQVLTNRLYEYQNYGPGAASHEMRRQLSDEEAKEYTPERILGWTDLGWL